MFCEYCYVKELKEDADMVICADCIQRDFYTFDIMKEYLATFNLISDYYSEMGTKIFSYILMREYINEDQDHFIEWCYKNAEQEKAYYIMKAKYN